MYFLLVICIHTRQIASIMEIPIGSFPFKYLGIRITSKKPSIKDCMPLVEKVASCLPKWKSKSLSCLGRIELIKSICYGSILLWCNAFQLPAIIADCLDHLLSRFLWTGSTKGIQKLSWKIITKPKSSGVVDIRNIKFLNSALLRQYI